MADWVTITDSQVDPDAPLTSELAYAWRDNPIAIAEGAVGAPRVVDAALSTTVTNTGQTWVAERMIARTHGGIGTLALAFRSAGSGSQAFGSTLAGSSLASSSALGEIGTTLSGTWRCLGNMPNNPSGSSRVTLWQRIS